MAIDQNFTSPPSAPSSSDPTNFRSRADAFIAWILTFVAQLGVFITQLNNTEANINAKEASAVAASVAAVASANYQGVFVQGTSNALLGESWSYNGASYRCAINTSNNPIAEPTSWVSTSIDAVIHAATSKTTLAGNDEIGFWDSVSQLLRKISFTDFKISIFASPALTGTPTVNGMAIDATAGGVRQTVRSSVVDTSGKPVFITAVAASLSVNVLGTAINALIHAAGGDPKNDRIGRIIADQILSGLPANSTVYIYADISNTGVITLGWTTLAPIYQFGGTPTIINGQCTFNISEMTMYVGNGTTAPQGWRVFLGEAVTDASSVTSVVNYALNGIYIKDQAVAVNTEYAINHNLGTNFSISRKTDFIFNRTIGQMVSGDIMTDIETVTNASYGNNKFEGKTGKLIYGFKTQSATVLAWYTNAGTAAQETTGIYRITFKRGW